MLYIKLYRIKKKSGNSTVRSTNHNFSWNIVNGYRCHVFKRILNFSRNEQLVYGNEFEDCCKGND